MSEAPHEESVQCELNDFVESTNFKVVEQETNNKQQNEQIGLTLEYASLFSKRLVMPAVIIRQRKAWRRRDGVFIYFEGMLIDAFSTNQCIE